MRRKLHIGLSLAPTWLSGEAWRRDNSRVEGIYTPGFAIDIARRAEAAKLDFVFLPDVQMLNLPDLAKGAAFSSLDPTILLGAVATATSRIGLLTTASTTFGLPYTTARQIQSLHWLSQGRAGWNIVTALAGNENFGLTTMPPAAERYARAAEFTRIVKELWQSFPDQALLMDRASGRFADVDLVRPIAHHGDFFDVAGPLNLPRFAGPPVPLFQAGASGDGRDFAAAVSDGVFSASPDMQAAQELRRDLQKRAVAAGRKATDIRLMPGFSVWLAPTRAEAADLYAAAHAGADALRKVAMIHEATGLDLGEWPDDRPILALDLPPPPAQVRNRTHADLLRRLIQRDQPTKAQLMDRPEVAGSAHWRVIGTVEDAVDALRQWYLEEAIDGVIATPGGSTGSMHMFLEEVVPELAELGMFRRDYSGDSFWHHLNEAV